MAKFACSRDAEAQACAVFGDDVPPEELREFLSLTSTTAPRERPLRSVEPRPRERFLQSRADEPLYLYTDEGVLRRWRGEVGIESRDRWLHLPARWPTRSPVTSPSWLGSDVRGCAGWRSAPTPSGGAVLPGAGRRRAGLHPLQYYPGLNRSLGRDSDGAPPGFEQHVPAMFRHFNAWLEGPGQEHGTPTAAPHPHYPNVGWPLSQAIVRPPDRALMVKLFSGAGLGPRLGLTGASLRSRVLPRLKLGSDTPARSRLLKLNAEHTEVLEDALEREYAAWDGSSVLVVGPRRVHLRLCFDETYGEWWFSAPQIAGTVGHSYQWVARRRSPPDQRSQATPDDIWRLVGAGDVGSIKDGPLLASRASARRWMSTDIRVGGWGETWLRDPDQDQLLLVPEGSPDASAPPTEAEHHEDSPVGFRLLRVPRGVPFADEDARTSPLVPLLEVDSCSTRQRARTFSLETALRRPATSAGA